MVWRAASSRRVLRRSQARVGRRGKPASAVRDLRARPTSSWAAALIISWSRQRRHRVHRVVVVPQAEAAQLLQQQQQLLSQGGGSRGSQLDANGAAGGLARRGSGSGGGGGLAASGSAAGGAPSSGCARRPTRFHRMVASCTSLGVSGAPHTLQRRCRQGSWHPSFDDRHLPLRRGCARACVCQSACLHSCRRCHHLWPQVRERGAGAVPHDAVWGHVPRGVAAGPAARRG